MSDLHFETPENVAVNFSPAGLGTRYVAWFADQIFVWLITIALLFVLACAGTSFHGVTELFQDVENGENDAGLIFLGLIMLVWGLGSFLYFGLCELFMRGQTPGKRMSKIRVVKSDGFSLDAQSILIRNVFRVLDHLPPLWIVPLLSARGQRLGDMVAGTVLVSDEQLELSSVRTELAERPALEGHFRFHSAALAKLSDTDLQATEQLLDRWNNLKPQQREKLLETIVVPLSHKLQVPAPDVSQRLLFLEDLLAAEIRRQQRGLA